MQKTIRNNSAASRSESISRRLRDAIEDIEAKISKLESEKDALKRQLAKASFGRVAEASVSRSNSSNRVLIEGAILSALIQTNGPLGTYSLRTEAWIFDRNLKDSTFRSHLHRLKNKGFIKSVGRGQWRITPDGVSAERSMHTLEA